tara:strand:- start:261 stop:935 length:675 start_codon:yes stop_codon:yes gene_type:complete
MEISNNPTTQQKKDDEWTNLLRCLDDTDDKETKKKIIDIIDERRKIQKEKSNTYKQRQALRDQMESIKKSAPQNALKIMMDLQIVIDDEDFEKANTIMFDPDNTDNLMDTIADLIFVCNHSEIIKPKKDMGVKITRAQILANAHDKDNKDYGFCPKCNRPMLFNSIKHHQANSLICIEIKAGRQKTLELGKRKDHRIGEYIAKQTLIDKNDSDDEEDEFYTIFQ